MIKFSTRPTRYINGMPIGGAGNGDDFSKVSHAEYKKKEPEEISLVSPVVFHDISTDDNPGFCINGGFTLKNGMKGNINLSIAFD